MAAHLGAQEACPETLSGSLGLKPSTGRPDLAYVAAMRRGEAAADTLPAAVAELWRMGVAVRWPAPPLTCTEPERAEYTSLSQMIRQLDKADTGRAHLRGARACGNPQPVSDGKAADKADTGRGAEKGKKHCDTGASRAIPQRTTGPAQPSLTSVIGREPVLCGWYDRSMERALL